MKRGLCAALIVPFISLGCADKEALNQYYTLEEKRTQAIVESINRQAADRTAARTQMMQAFSMAASSAAVTTNNADDVAVAMAWGFMLADPDEIKVPTIQPVKAPDQNSDLLKAWTPLIGMALPFVYPLFYGWSGAGSGSSYTARENGRVYINSENSGSGNTAGGNMTLTNNDSRNQLEEDCIECESQDDGLAGIEVEPPIECEGWDGATTDVDGVLFLGSPSSGCSCTSWQGGRCTP